MRRIRRYKTEEVQEGAKTATALLAGDPRVDLVFLFGSATEDHEAVEDLDLAILTSPRLNPEEVLRLRARIGEEVQVPIDLVSLNDAPVILSHEVAETGQCLFARQPELETEFVVRSRSRYWDFLPFFAEQERIARLRSAARSGDS